MGAPFRIEFERSGGFAGVSLKTSVDSRAIPPDEVREFDELLDRIDAKTLANSSGAAATQPDQFQYDLTIEHGGKRKQLTVRERDVPKELRPLLDRLLERAKKRT
jgi:hypothetical protein